MQTLARRLENGGVLPVAGVCQAAQPFLAVLLQQLCPKRPLVIVAPDLKTQESLQQDLETWLAIRSAVHSSQSNVNEAPSAIRNRASSLFYPPWEILPHEGKLPHADTISDRLQTLVALSETSAIGNRQSAMVVTSVTALLQKTFPPGEIQRRTRTLQRGDKINPLDLIEWLEEQGYEPEAQVTQKGEIALRGGILDVWPLTSPWPVRLEFFGDELGIAPPFRSAHADFAGRNFAHHHSAGGELGILKRSAEPPEVRQSNHPNLATLLDYLPRETIFLLCEPEQLAVRADEYAAANSRRRSVFHLVGGFSHRTRPAWHDAAGVERGEDGVQAPVSAPGAG